MNLKRLFSLLAAIGLIWILVAIPVMGERPPRPGPDYNWEKHHTTPEGHYVPGRWVRTPTNSPCPQGRVPWVRTTRLPPPVPWVNPYTPPPATVAPQYSYDINVPVAAGASCLVPAVIGASVLWNWNGLYAGYATPGVSYSFGYRYPLPQYHYYKPGKEHCYHGREFGNHYKPPVTGFHSPAPGKNFKPYKPELFKGKAPGKVMKHHPGLPHGKVIPGKSVAKYAGGKTFDPLKK